MDRNKLAKLAKVNVKIQFKMKYIGYSNLLALLVRSMRLLYHYFYSSRGLSRVYFIFQFQILILHIFILLKPFEIDNL